MIALGLGTIVVGALIWGGAFSWFGRLPGDIRIETENSRVFIPLGSMLIVSAVLTLVVNLISRL